jgi:hypothetical protein
VTEQRLELGDGAIDAEADAIGALIQLSHVVGEEIATELSLGSACHQPP